MTKAFKSLDATVPSNLITGQNTLRVAGGAAQIFDAKTQGATVGYVAQIEFQEVLHVIAINAVSKKVISVIRDGTSLEENEWKELSFVEDIRAALFPANTQP